MPSKILIVEDEAIIALTLENTLTNLGYEICDKVDRGENVYSAVQKHHPDLVLMDIMLKGNMTGVEAAHSISKEGIPVVYLTSYSDDEVLKKSKATNPYGYVVKPFQARELQISIEIALFKHLNEKKIKLAETKYEKLAESIPQIIFECNEKGEMSYLNKAGFRLLSIKKKEFKKGIYFTSFFENNLHIAHGENIAAFAHHLHSEKGFECKMKKANGKLFFAQLHVKPILINKEFKGISGVIIDQTGKKKAELCTEITDQISKLSLFPSISERDVYEYLADCLPFVFEFDELYMAEFKPQEDELSFFYSSKNGFLETPETRKSGNGASEYVVKNNKPIRLSEKRNIDFHEKHGVEFKGERALSWIGIPINDSQRPCGIIALQSFSNPNCFSKDDQKELQRIANHLGVVIEKVRTKNELEASEKKYKGLFNSIIDIFYVAKVDGTIIEISPSVFEMTGYTPQDFYEGNLVKHYKNPEDRNILLRELEKYNEVRDYQVAIFHKNGSEIIISVNAKAVRNKKGKLVGYEAVSRDVTNIVKAAKAKTKLMTELEFAQEVGRIGSYETDLVNNTFRGSKMFCEMFGFEYDTIYTIADFEALLHPKDMDTTLSHFEYSLANQIDFNGEYRVINRLTGEIIYIESKSKIFYDENGRPLRIFGTKKDISKLKTKELELKKAQRLANLGSWKWSEETDAMSWSDEYYGILGYEPQEVVPTRDLFFSHLHEQDKEDILEWYDQLEKGNYEPFDNEFRMWDKQGSIKYLKAVSSVSKLGNGKLELFGVVHDVTAEKVQELQIIKLSSAIENTQDLVFITDIKGNFIYANSAYQSIVGYTHDELMGRNCKMLKSGFHTKSFYEEMWDVIVNKKETFKAEFINKKKSGEYYYEDKTISPILNEKGEIDSFVSIGRDITERKKTIRKLEESERRFRNILENVNFIALQVDLSGNITYANSKLCNVLGVKNQAEILGKNWFEHFIPESISLNIKNLFYQNILDSKESSANVNPILTIDKKFRYISWSNSVLLDDEGNIIGLASLGDDITDEKRIERQLRAKTKLDYFIEKRNRKKSLRQLLKGQELERKRMSKELHDGLGQQLVGLKFLANSLKAKEPSLETDVKILTDHINETINEVRRISYALMPSALSDFGLLAGIERTLAIYQNAGTEVSIRLSITGEERRFDEAKEVAVFRIFQEALSNAIRHANSEYIDVMLVFAEHIQLTIKDYGVWKYFSPSNLRDGIGNGISNLLDRAESMDLKLSINSNNKGTSIEVTINE